ncbi:MAG: hypothetical protein ACLRZH_14035 [Ruthenibacterium lactatiformans]
MPEEQRVIFHCDCNSFYASVGCCATRRARRARGRMRQPGRPPWHRPGEKQSPQSGTASDGRNHLSALRKCPGPKLLPPHHGQYREMSRAVNAIYARYTDRIEPFGIDESWLDMTQTWRLFGSSPAGVADAVRRAVKAETGLTISVGVSFNKVFAKLGSDYKKPDAVTVIDTENFRRIVWPLPVNTLLYVGRSAQTHWQGWASGTSGMAAAKDEDSRGAGQAGARLGAYARGGESPCVPRTSVRR